MSSSKFVPPKFIDDSSQYAEYKRRLERWSRLTKTDPKQQAEVVLYHLELENHPSGIHEKIDTAIGDEIIEEEDGMKKLIDYLDSIYQEDEMTDMWLKYKKFVRLKKSKDQPISEFVAEFESAYKEAKDNGCEVSDTVLALNLLDACDLSETDEKFVLTAVDFKAGKEKKDCLDQVKKSLRKFQSRDRMSAEKECDRLQTIEEDAYIADVKDALISDGWRPPISESESKVRQNSTYYKGLKNRLGADGKPLRCFYCDSEYHMSYECDKKEEKKETVEAKPSGSKSKKNSQSSKGRGKKKTEQTMLSTVLQASKKYSMVCDVHSVKSMDVLDDFEEEIQTLSDLLMKCGESKEFGTHSDKEEEVILRPKTLADLLNNKSYNEKEPVMLSDCKNSSAAQCSYVCEVGQEEPSTAMVSYVVSTTTQCSFVVEVDRDNGKIDSEKTRVTLKDLLSTSEVSCMPVKETNLQNCNEQPEKQLTLHDLLENSAEYMTVDISPTSTGAQEEIDSENNLVLVSQGEDKLCLLVEEAGRKGVLDSGCSKSVAGMQWIGHYTDAISSDFSKEIELVPSNEVYQFGGGEKRRSKGCVSVPTLIGDNRVYISMDVVDAAIPLLIGTNSMKAGKANLDFNKYEATFFGETVPMIEVGSGHFCITLVSDNLLTHIDDVREREEKVQDTLVAMETVKVSDLKKFHHFYGHTHPEKLLKFLKNAGKDTEGLRAALEKIENSCESCKRSKRKKPRPQCAIPRVDGPDQILTVDLKEWEGKGNKRYICYLVDMFSRLTTGSFIPNKLPDTIANCILVHWISKFGIFRGIHSDIGGEFSNALMDDVASKLGIEVTTTASYSPHQNGLNERNHAVVDLMVTRMLESDRHLSPETALMWAFNAKNSLDNHCGYSPFQLHIGKNPKLLSATCDGPPALENDSLSKNFVKHMNAMFSAREQFVKLQASTSLKKALKSKVHTRGHDIQEGDLIYYKKSDGKGKNVIWKGPSKVTAVNGKKLFIDQGAKLGTVNRDDAVRVGEELWRMDDEHAKRRTMSKKREGKKLAPKTVNSNKKTPSKETKSVVRKKATKVPDRKLYSSSSSESEDEHEESEVEGEVTVEEEEEEDETISGDNADTLNDLLTAGEGSRVEAETLNNDEDDEERNSRSENESILSGNAAEVDESEEVVSEEELSTQNEPESEEDEDPAETEYEDAIEAGDVDVPGSSKANQTAFSISCEDVKKGDVISYKIPETEVEETAIVKRRAAKATGSNKYWWVVEVQGSLEEKSVNAEGVLHLKKVNTKVTPTLVVSVPRYLHNEPECLAAKEKELQNWRDFGVFREVEDVGQKTINTNWVLVRKEAGIKARLCIRGDQEPNKNTIPTDSPTVNKVNIKLFYVLAASLGWTIQVADVKAAFLQGSDLDRDVFVRPPIEARRPGIIWKMIKRAYGFVDASRGFYLELEKTLLNLGCNLSRYDPAMYIYFNPKDKSLSGMLLTHVDDFIHGSGDNVFHQHVMIPLKERFKFGSEADEDFLYVGMHVVQSSEGIDVDQERYVEELEVPYIKTYSEAGNLDITLDDDGQADYRAVVGRIGYISNSTRPDLAYDNMILSMKLGNATVRDMRLACRTVKRIKCDGTQMKFVDLGPMKEWSLYGFGDAGYKSLPDKTSSCGGQVILLCNKKRGIACVLDWKTKKLKRVVPSSTAAEALAANDTLDMLVYLHSILTELFGEIGRDIPVELATDSKNLHDGVMNSTLVESPRLRTDIAMLKESIKSRELQKFILVTGRTMIADVLTKKGAAGFKLMNLLRTCEM